MYININDLWCRSHSVKCKNCDPNAKMLGDLNQCHLESVLPGFEQYVKDKTRKDVNVKHTYVSNCKNPFLNSDHNVLHLIPVFKTKLKRSKLERKVIRTWPNENKE